MTIFQSIIQRLCRDPLFPIFIVLFIFLVFTIVFAKKQKERKALKNLLLYLGGYLSKNPFVPKFIGSYQGINYDIILSSGKEDEPEYMYIIFFKKPSFCLSILKENILTKISNKIKLFSEIKIGDAEFDKKYFIRTDQKERAINYLNNREKKEIIDKLFNDSFNHILFNAEKIVLKKPNYDLEKDLIPAKVTKILEYLTTLSQGI